MKYYIDLRYFVLVAINMLKSIAALAWDWDPYHTITKPTWVKAWFLAILFLILPFTTIKVFLFRSSDSENIVVRFGEFNPQLTIALIASLIFPQALFWYAYPIIIIISLCSSWLITVLATIPIVNIIIRATVAENIEEVEPQPEAIGWCQQPQEPVQMTEVYVDDIEPDRV